ncbi:hypothetical protein ACPV5L_19275, partial [Vibrio astriarenae]
VIVSPVVYEVHSNTSNQVAKLTMPLHLNIIQDNANFTNPRQTSSGHKYVMVNGQLIIDSGQRVEGSLPGKAIRNV